MSPREEAVSSGLISFGPPAGTGGGADLLIFLSISTVALKGTFSSPDGWHLLLCSGVLEAEEQSVHDISNVPKALWDAGYDHPDGVAKGLDPNALAALIKQPPCVAGRILSICERYSSELGQSPS